MKKNTPSQKVGAQMITAADGTAFTGAVTVYVTGDAGTQAVGSVGAGACTHEGNGYHSYAPATAETNYDLIGFTFIGTGAVPVTLQVYPQEMENLGVKEIGVPSAVTASTVTLEAGHTFGTNTLAGNTIMVKGSTQGYWQEMGILSNTNANPCVVTLTDNFVVTPTGSFSSKIFATAAGSTANPPLVKLAPITHTSAVIPTVTSVGAVSGAVGSVTGAVGSVTGNVGGNVVGSVGSVIGITAANVGSILTIANKLDTAMEVDGAVYRFTVNALELAPSGTGASAATIRDAIFARTFEATKMSGLTFEEIVALGATALFGKVSGLPTAPVFRNLGDTANAISATTDTSGNRSAVTTTLTAVR